jgi:hypothetical protein
MSANDFITVVTGLPRSGTSMMMQMLAAGGLPPLTDGQRTADEDNPRGYLEYDKTKSLRSDNTRLAEAKGQAVKVIAQLLECLPQGNYHLILMQRDLSEVVRSQRAMLDRSGKQGAKLSDEQLGNAFSKQLLMVDRILEARNLPVLRVSYRSCIESPRVAAAEVNQFLGGGLDEPAIVEAIDANLYRQKSESATPGT